MTPNSPCTRDCPNRTFDCHSKCYRYLIYTAQRRKVYEANAKRIAHGGDELLAYLQRKHQQSWKGGR